jgi:hypothetical protein
VTVEKKEQKKDFVGPNDRPVPILHLGPGPPGQQTGADGRRGEQQT